MAEEESGDPPVIKVNQRTEHQTGGESIGLKINQIEHVDQLILQTYGAQTATTTLQVPPVARHAFLGRALEKQQMVESLRAYRTALVHGAVGMGKTALAAGVAVELHQARVYKNGIVWISDVGNAPLSAVCDAVARQLGDAAIPRLSPPAKPDALRSLLATRAEILLVLDALEDVTTAQGVLDHCLPEQVAFLATSRTVHPIFDAEVTVRPLEPGEAVQLFENRARVTPGDPIVGQICGLVGYHPQAIVLAAGRHRAEKIPLPRLLARLGDERRRLSVLDADADTSGLGVALSSAVNALKDGARSTFLYLSACFGDWTTVPLLAAARGVSQDACEDEVGQLAKRSLIERDDDGRLVMQRLVRDFGSSLEPPDLATRRLAVLMATVGYVGAPVSSINERYARLEGELGNLVGAVGFAMQVQDFAAALTLIEALAHPVEGMLAVRGHWVDLVTLLDFGQQAAEHVGNDSKRAWFQTAAAIARYRRGERKEAWRLYVAALRAYARLGDRIQRAKVLHNIGKMLQDQGNYKGASRAYERSLRLKGSDDAIGTARTLHEIGRMATTLGDYPSARESFTKSLAAKQAARDDLGVALTTFTLARVDHIQGHYTVARTRYEASQRIYQRLEDNAGTALVTHYLGRLAYDQGDGDTASRLYALSYEAFDELKSAAELADVLCDRAVLSVDRADFVSADGDFVASLAIKAQINDVGGQAACQLEQVRGWRLQGRLLPARETLDRATAVVRKQGEQSAIVRACFENGCLTRVTYGDAAAAPLFADGLQLATTLGLRMEMAEHGEQLAEIAAGAGDTAVALDRFRACLALYEQLNRSRAERVKTRLGQLEKI